MATENKIKNLSSVIVLILWGLFTILSLIGCIVTCKLIFIVSGAVSASVNGYLLYCMYKAWKSGEFGHKAEEGD